MESHTESPLNRIAVVLIGCLLLAACHARNKPLATPLDVLLDSLTPGLRLGDDPAAVALKLPGFRLRPDRGFDTTLDGHFLGHAGLSVYFEGGFGTTLGAPPPPASRLAVVILAVPTDSQFARAVAAISRWLPLHADTLCAGSEEHRWKVLRWKAGPTESVVATPPPPAPFTGPGYLEIVTTALASTRLAEPRLVACKG